MAAIVISLSGEVELVRIAERSLNIVSKGVSKCEVVPSFDRISTPREAALNSVYPSLDSRTFRNSTSIVGKDALSSIFDEIYK